MRRKSWTYAPQKSNRTWTCAGQRFHRQLACDAVCEEAADGACAASAATSIIERWIARTQLSCRRIAILEAATWSHGPTLCDAPAALEPFEPPIWIKVIGDIETLISNHGHVLRLEGGWIRCGLCHRRRRPHASRLWLETPCIGKRRGIKRSPAAIVTVETQCISEALPLQANAPQKSSLDDPDGEGIDEWQQESTQASTEQVSADVRKKLIELPPHRPSSFARGCA